MQWLAMYMYMLSVIMLCAVHVLSSARLYLAGYLMCTCTV